MEFCLYTMGLPLRRNRFGIPEPLSLLKQQRSSDLDLVLLPLVGFDKRCNRLGMGAGFYDRALAKLHCRGPFCIGVAYDFQRVEELPVDPWDVPLQAVVTERRIYRRIC